MDPFELYAIDGLLTDEERAIRDTVRDFGARELRPHVATWFDEGRVPARDLARQLGALGILGMHLEGYGCAGTGAVAYGLACQEMEAVDSGLRSLVSVQGSLAMYAIHAYGSEEQRQEWLPGMAAGEKLGCFGLTEPDAGSNPASMRTVAKRDASVTGFSTAPSSGSPTARSPTSPSCGRGPTTGSAVSSSRPTRRGSRPTRSTRSSRCARASRASWSSTTSGSPRTRCCRAPPGSAGPLGCLNEARFGIIFGSLGAARDSLETALDYAKTREVFDKPLAAYQLTQQKLADMAVELGNGMLLALHLGRLKEAGTVTPEQVSVGKLNNVRKSLAIAREARTILGANGISLEYSPIRHAANLESVLTYEGTTEVHTLVIGKALTGENAFN